MRRFNSSTSRLTAATLRQSGGTCSLAELIGRNETTDPAAVSSATGNG